MKDPRIEAAAKALWDYCRIITDPNWEDAKASGDPYSDDIGQMRDMAQSAITAIDNASIITTGNELAELPIGSVILYGQRTFQRYEPELTSSGFEYHMWMSADGGFVREHTSILLPARVLHWGQA